MTEVPTDLSDELAGKTQSLDEALEALRVATEEKAALEQDKQRLARRIDGFTQQTQEEARTKQALV